MLSKFIFTNLSEGSSGDMQLFILITDRRVYWMVWIFILRFSSRPFLLLVGEAAFPPIKIYTRLIEQLEFSRCFFFDKVHSPTPWIFYFSGLSAVSDLDIISRVTIRSWGSFWLFNVSDIFVGGFEMVWWNFRALSVWPGQIIRSYLM